MEILPYVKGHIPQCPVQHATLPYSTYMLTLCGHTFMNERQLPSWIYSYKCLGLFSAVMTEHVTIFLLMADK